MICDDVSFMLYYIVSSPVCMVFDMMHAVGGGDRKVTGCSCLVVLDCGESAVWLCTGVSLRCR